MSIYGYDEKENGSWKARLRYMLLEYEKKQGGQFLEYNGMRYYLLKDLVFTEINKTMRAGNICKILEFEKDISMDLILDQELSQLQMEEEGPVKNGICYYLTNLDLAKTEDKEKIEQIEKIFSEQTSNSFIREYWGLKEMYSLMKNLTEEMGRYTSYFTEEELKKTGIADIQKSVKETLCRYLIKSFQGDRFSRMEQAGSVTDEKVTLQKVFVDLNAYKENMNTDTDSGMFVSEMIHQGNCENRKKTRTQEQNGYHKYLLLGTAGQGKSTVCQYLVQIYRVYFLKRYLKDGLGEEYKSFLREYEQIVAENIQCTRIPVHIVIKEYAAWMKKQKEKDEICGIAEYICSQIRRKSSDEFTVGHFRNLLTKTSWLFVFDGLDEVPDSSNRSSVIQELQDFQSNELDMIECDYMTICTSRPQGNLEGLSENDYCRLRLRELTSQQCMVYLTRLVEQMSNNESEKERFLDVLKESVGDPVVSYLMKSPLQATIVAILVKTGGKPPKDRFNLFATYYDTIKNREKQKDALESLHDSMDWIDDIHYEIAYKLQKESQSDSNPSAAIGRSKFRQIIWDYIKDTNGERDAEELCDPFFHAITERLCFITDVNTEGEYMFTIRSMQEFLAANKIVREANVVEELKLIAPFSYWRNVFLFAAGYLQKNMKSRNRDIQDICEKLNGKVCTPGQYSLEKIAKAGSWLALDILLEGIYKGAKVVEKVYYDIFFEIKDQASVEKISECSRLASEKKEFLREEYIIPQIQKEPKNRVLWHLLCMTSDKGRPLDELKKANLKSEERLKLLIYLDEKLSGLFAEGQITNRYILELLEDVNADIDLSYKKCCELLFVGIKIENLAVKQLIWKNMILHNAEIAVPLNSEEELPELPQFWKKMENILIRCTRAPARMKVADIVSFRIQDINRDEKNILVLREAAEWMDEQGFLIESAFIRMIICPKREAIEQYIHVLWQEDVEVREKWLHKHERQFYVVNWLKRQYNTRTLCSMKEEEILSLLNLDFVEGCQWLKKAVTTHDWGVFWKWSQLGNTHCSPVTEEKLLEYLKETHCSVEEIDKMSEEELGTFLFVGAILVNNVDLNKTAESVLKAAYEEYQKRRWKLCWVNIWARQIALYLLNIKNKNELFTNEDGYNAFLNTEEEKYLYRAVPYFNAELGRLWENIIWMLNAVESDHVIFRVIPALCMCMPPVNITVLSKSYRQLISVVCKDELSELGRLFALMLLPDLTDEECEVLTEKIITYIDNTEKENILLFLQLMNKYPVQQSLQSLLYEKIYCYLEDSGAWNYVKGRKLLARVCESAYLKVQES